MPLPEFGEVSVESRPEGGVLRVLHCPLDYVLMDSGIVPDDIIELQ